MITYLELSTFLFWQHLEIGTDPEGAAFLLPVVIYICEIISASHMGTRNQNTFAYIYQLTSRVFKCP